MDAGSEDDPGPRPDAAAQPVEVLEELLALRGEHLLRTAVLLAGSRADGEDLLQAALERLFRRWRTIRATPRGTSGGRSITWPPTAGGATGPGARGCACSATRRRCPTAPTRWTSAIRSSDC